MKTNSPTLPESTYSLLVHSQERERNLSETAVYTMLTLSIMFSLWQAVQQPFTVPVSVPQSAPIVQTIAASEHRA